MSLWPSIFLAASDSSVVDVVVWLIAGAIWLFLQISAAKKKMDRKARPAPPPDPSAVRPGDGESPTPDELTEIFKRLGGDIPGTPSPAPRIVPAPRPAVTTASPPPSRRTAAAGAAPTLAQRLAQAKRAAAGTARHAEIERRDEDFAAHAIVPVVQIRTGENHALNTATRHTGAILPRMYAMGMRLTPWPNLPIPGFGRTQQTGVPMRAKLHSRREVRDALVAQIFLQPAKELSGR